MPRDGSGTFTRAVTPPNNGDVADADDYNAEQDDVATALTGSINASGTKAFAADQSMGGFKLTNLGTPTNSGDAVSKTYLEGRIGVSIQGYDATLTALAALSWSSGNALVQFTAADTISLTLTPSVTDLTLSGQLKAAAGSAAAPSQSFSGDLNSGWFSVADNQIGLGLNGAHVLTFNSTHIVSLAGMRFSTADGTAGAPGFRFANDDDNGWYRIGTNNWAGAVGGSKFVDYSTTLVAYSLPVQARIPLSSETSGTLTTASANKKINASGGITLPASVFTADDAIIIDGNGTARTITRGSGLTMYVNGTDSATATLTANGVMGVTYRSATVCILTGNVS